MAIVEEAIKLEYDNKLAKAKALKNALDDDIFDIMVFLGIKEALKFEQSCKIEHEPELIEALKRVYEYYMNPSEEGYNDY